MGNTTKLRDELLRELSGIRQDNEARIGDPYFSSSTGYNMAAWAEKGYERAMVIVGINFLKEEESVAEYAARFKRLLEVKQGEYVNDNADEGWRVRPVRSLMRSWRWNGSPHKPCTSSE